MSALFPHAAYAEDQTLPYLILTTHVLNRGFQSGALLGTMYGVGRRFFLTRGRTLLSASLLRSAGFGGLIGNAIMTGGLVTRMWGREEIEWQDRAWRLLENKGQIECDTFSTAGAIAGAATVAWRRGLRNSNWRYLLGGAGLGSLMGVVTYMGWRYGVKGGEWEEAAEKVVEEVNPAMPVAGAKK